MRAIQAVREFLGRRINEKGQEVPDPTPASIPLGYRHPEPLEVRMRRMIAMEMSSAAAAGGMETFEEANDFNVGEEDGEFPDEDFAVNDPNVLAAFQAEVPVVREKLSKASKAKAEPAPAAPTPPPAAGPNQ